MVVYGWLSDESDDLSQKKNELKIKILNFKKQR